MRSGVLTLAFAVLMLETAAAEADVPGIATTNTRLHTRPGASAPVIRSVPQGARLTVLSCADRWCLAEWRGIQGYLSQNLMHFPNGSASVDRGSTDDQDTTVVRRVYVEPGYVAPDDSYPDYPDDGYNPYYGPYVGGYVFGPGYYGGRYNHGWRGRHGWHDGSGWHHWRNGQVPPGQRPGWTPQAGRPGPFVRPQNPNPVINGRPAFHQPSINHAFQGPRPGGPMPHTGPMPHVGPGPILRR